MIAPFDHESNWEGRPNSAPSPRSFARAAGWFWLGFILGVAFVLALGLYLSPARGKAWIDPPMVMQ